MRRESPHLLKPLEVVSGIACEQGQGSLVVVIGARGILQDRKFVSVQEALIPDEHGYIFEADLSRVKGALLFVPQHSTLGAQEDAVIVKVETANQLSEAGEGQGAVVPFKGTPELLVQSCCTDQGSLTAFHPEALFLLKVNDEIFVKAAGLSGTSGIVIANRDSGLHQFPLKHYPFPQ